LIGDVIVKRYLRSMISRRIAPVVGACVLLTGGIGASVLLGTGAAQATACLGTPLAAGTACTDIGTLTFTAGSLTFTPPTVYTWTATDTGVDQSVLAVGSGQEAILVNDATGSGTGWNVTASSTQFTATGPIYLPLTALSLNGSATSATVAATPTAACSAATTCTLPTDSGVTYPVTAIETTPLKIYDAAAATGMGSIVLGLPGANPMGWWVTIPANQKPGTYTSTITLEVLSAP
jgi:hypothetical protein